MARRSPHPIPACTTISEELERRLQARVKLLGISRAEALRNLLASHPDLNPRPQSRGGEALEE
jgi:hypothetical protein